MQQLQRIPELRIPLSSTRYARASGSIGCLIPNLESTLENEIPRNKNSYDLQILSCNFTPYTKNLILQTFYRNFFPLYLNQIVLRCDRKLALIIAKTLPKWHYARAFFTLNFNEDIFGAINIYKKAKLDKRGASFEFSPREVETEVTWSRRATLGDFTIGTFTCQNAKIIDGRYVVVKEYLLPDGTTLMQGVENAGGWPNSIWSTKTTHFVAVPNSSREIYFNSTDLLFPSNPNWHHFIEEILPRLVIAQSEVEFKRIVTSAIYDKAQLEAVHYISSKPIVFLERSHNYVYETLSATVYDERRSLAIKNLLNGAPMLDQEAMLAIKATADELLATHPLRIAPPLVYVQRRNSLFRRLINKEVIEQKLHQLGFNFVKAEDLSFVERVQVFGNAKIIVLESGAGMGNLHFCSPNTIVLELRHPGFQKSTEEVVFLREGLKMNKIIGNNGSIFQRLAYGTDSYKISYYNFRKVLLDLL